MSRVAVLGGGKMGKVIAAYLADEHEVLVFDQTNTSSGQGRITWHKTDLSDPSSVNSALWQHQLDLVVVALPAKLGYLTVKTVLKCGLDCVDLSFSKEDTGQLGKEFMGGPTCIYDAGFAPGLPNLLIGKALHDTPWGLEDVRIYVGGVAAVSAVNPYGYIATWSVEDMKQEFLRPARFRDKHKEHQIMPWAALVEQVQVGPYILEGFISDGLRSLLKQPNITTMVERTLRWPGHVAKVLPLLEGLPGEFERAMEGCNEGEDMAVMRVDASGGGRWEMIAWEKDGVSAMARVTAGACVAFANLILKRDFNTPGVFSPEQVSLYRPGTVQKVLNSLEKRGIHINQVR